MLLICLQGSEELEVFVVVMETAADAAVVWNQNLPINKTRKLDHSFS